MISLKTRTLPVGDVFCSKDLSGWAKALWLLGLIAVAWPGVLSNIIIRGDGLEERNANAMIEAEQKRRAYTGDASLLSVSDERGKRAQLKDKGVITEDEFRA